MLDLSARIKEYKQSARSLIVDARYSEALQQLDRLIALLRNERARALEAADPESDDSVAEFDAQLADCYGIRGGALRRAGRLAEALAAYEEGLVFERNDSYNLTNTVVLRALMEPQSIETLRPYVESAKQKVERQIIRSRRGEWWAWADLALLSVLSADVEGAFRAYQQFQTLGAGREAYDSAASVLKQLKDGLEEAQDERHASVIADALEFVGSARPT